MSRPCVHSALVLLLFHSIGAAFDFDSLRLQARALASKAPRSQTNQLPESLAGLSYDQYRAIQFRPAKALWRESNLPYQIEFFHPGSHHKQIVTISEINAHTVRAIPFQPEFFDYGTTRVELPPNPSYAGFRIVHPVRAFGEVAVFLDASYLRMVGRGQVYGTSARGLALDTVAGAGEEFPVFSQFWIRKPGKKASDITLYALLESPSVTGAYQFVIEAGDETVATVKACLFPRRDVKKSGIAPLSSMFLHGENGTATAGDFRPEVHDADGLLIHNGRGEWIWRPLDAGKMLRINAYVDDCPQGFGLLQRDRDYEHYQDTVARYEKRPSVWVRPLGKWGKGAVELVQLPTDLEYTDNIVAFWVPDHSPAAGSVLELDYELHWTLADPTPRSLGYVQATRVGRTPNSSPEQPANLRFVVDFAGQAVESLSDNERLSADVQCETNPVVRVSKNKVNQTWRLVIEIPVPRKAVDLRAFLRRGEQPVTETWTYTWQP